MLISESNGKSLTFDPIDIEANWSDIPHPDSLSNYEEKTNIVVYLRQNTGWYEIALESVTSNLVDNYQFFAIYEQDPSITPVHEYVEYAWCSALEGNNWVVSCDTSALYVGYFIYKDGKYQNVVSVPLKDAIIDPDTVRHATIASRVKTSISTTEDNSRILYMTVSPPYYGVTAFSGPASSGDSKAVYGWWTNPNDTEFDYIYLYDHEPSLPYDDNYYSWCATWRHMPAKSAEAGYAFTVADEFSVRNVNKDWWVAYVRYTDSYKIMKVTKLVRHQPNWMGLLKQESDLGKNRWSDLTVSKIFFPGTHDSASYDMFSKLNAPFTKTQTLSFLEQLNHGVRWLDLRLGYYPSYDEPGYSPFYLVHGTHSTNITLGIMLKQVTEFLDKNTDEIVILNFHRFPVGVWKSEDKDLSDKEKIEVQALHDRVIQDVVDAIESIGVNLLLEKDHTNKTIKDIYTTKSRVVLSYNNNARQKSPNCEKVCPPLVVYYWENKANIDNLLPELNREVNDSSGSLDWMWGTGTQLTQQFLDGPSVLTWLNIAYLNKWIRENGPKLSVVPVDFVEASSALKFAKSINNAKS